MADLNGTTIAATYDCLLKLNDNGTMPTDTVEPVTDGRGTASSLSLSAQRASINLGTDAGDDFIVDTTKLCVSGDANAVGIGTITPGSTLELANSGGQACLALYAFNSASGDPLIKWGQRTDSTSDSVDGDFLWGMGVDKNDSHKFNICYDASGVTEAGDGEVLTITTGGDVGLNTNAPNGELDVYRSSGETRALIRSVNNIGGLTVQGTSSEILFIDVSGSAQDARIVCDGNDLIFKGGSDSGDPTTNLMHIQLSGGRIGIGDLVSAGVSSSAFVHIKDPVSGIYPLFIDKTTSVDPRGLYITYSGGTFATTSNWYAVMGDASDEAFSIRSNGSVMANGSALSSDRDMKENIVDATPKLDDLLKLKVRNFNFKSKYVNKCQHKRIGFIAQEVEEVFPSLVSLEQSTNKSEQEAGIKRRELKQVWEPMIIKAIQELSAKVTALENA
tara:strand:- start:721 stop:2058 length:1338 start_codon:yes stop_codon:yes gene_type:complete